MSNPLPSHLTRAEISLIVGNDPRAIRAFEQLLRAVNTVLASQIQASQISELVSYNQSQETGNDEELMIASPFVQHDGKDNDAELLNLKGDGQEEKIANLESEIQSLRLAPEASYPHFRHTPYGEFYDTTTQTAAAINTAYPITYNTISYADGVEIGTPASRIYVLHDGVYNFQFSAELSKASASLGQVWIWSRIDGVDQVDSAGRIGLSGSSADTIASWNYVYYMTAGQYFELVWATDNTGCVIKTEAATAVVPAVPSILLTVTDNIKSLQY